MEIVCNSLTSKDLLAELGTISYYRGVTEEDFWRAVGRALASRRRDKGITALAIEKGDGPTNKTLQDIEAGRIGQLSKLREYAAAVGVDLVDLFRSVLRTDDEDGSPELQYVIRQFKSSSVRGRATIFQVAQLAEERQDQLPPQSTAGRRPRTPGKPRAETSTAKRREGK